MPSIAVLVAVLLSPWHKPKLVLGRFFSGVCVFAFCPCSSFLSEGAAGTKCPLAIQPPRLLYGSLFGLVDKQPVPSAPTPPYCSSQKWPRKVSEKSMWELCGSCRSLLGSKEAPKWWPQAAASLRCLPLLCPGNPCRIRTKELDAPETSYSISTHSVLSQGMGSAGCLRDEAGSEMLWKPLSAWISSSCHQHCAAGRAEHFSHLAWRRGAVILTKSK